MTTRDIEVAADALWTAAASGKAIAPLRETFPGFGPQEAYAVQEINTQRKLQAGGRLAVSYTHLTLPTNREV